MSTWTRAARDSRLRLANLYEHAGGQRPCRWRKFVGGGIGDRVSWVGIIHLESREATTKAAAAGRQAAPGWRAETHEKRPELPCWWREHGSERPRSGEQRRPEVCAKPPHQPRPTPRASTMAVPPQHAVVRPCIGRLSVVAGTARVRCCSPFAAVCWAETLLVTAAEAGRALGPVLPASARERWPFSVLRDSCHAALPDQPGLPPIGSGRQTGGSLATNHTPSYLRHMNTAWM
eukprot:COSAG02_NODE_212_length_28729_cov_45.980196_8_plen_233_part_00